MGFLSPWFLVGLAAVGLPVWFHLLKRHRSEPRPFSSLMFFERRTQSSILHRRLRYLLLFALRTALIVLLALTFAGPFIKTAATPAGAGHRTVVLAIDRSFSMSQGDRLARAKREAAAVLAGLTPGASVQVLEFASQARILAQTPDDRAALRAAIEAIAPSASRSSYGGLVRALGSVAQSAPQPLEIHLFSDLQRTSLPPGFIDLQLPPGARLVLHPVARARLANWSVESVNAPARLFGPNKGRVQATVAGYGTEPASRRVSLVLDGKVLDTKIVAVLASGRATVDFLSLDVPYGLHHGEVRIDSADPFPADDHFYFSIGRGDPRSALFIHEPRDSQSLLYFRAALEAAPEPAFTLDAVTASQAAGLPLDKYAFVVLSGVRSLPASFEGRLVEYGRGGGGLLVALGPGFTPGARVPVFGEAILEPGSTPRAGARFQSAAWLDEAHPSVRRANHWDGVRFYQVSHVTSGASRVVARATDQTPLLLEKQEGAGRILLFSSAFDNVASDFPLHAAFVPFVNETARYLAGLEDRPGAFTVGALLDLGASRLGGGSVEVIDPGGRRALTLAESAAARDLPLVLEGFYDVRRAGVERELIAVNPDRRESDFDMIPEDELALWQNTGQGTTPRSGTLAAEPRPRTLWWQGMLLVFALALAESLVAGRFLATRTETP